MSGFSGYSDLPLGKNVVYPERYDPTLLCPIPRSTGRASLVMPAQMKGSDLWNAYELSWLDDAGKPQVACGQFRFSADSVNLVESKSFKLYLNSLNQTRFPHTEALRQALGKDLERVSQGVVEVELFSPVDWAGCYAVVAPAGVCLDALPVSDPPESPNAQWIRLASRTGEARYYTDLFRSCCPVTGQPDWATVEIALVGNLPDEAALLRYLLSFRNNNEFHEQCVERIYVDLMQVLQPEKLSVYARYTRRGGLDINPLRSSHETSRPFARLARQ